VAVSRISTAPKFAPVAGCTVAKPLASDGTTVWDEETITGMGFRVMMIPPRETGGGAGAVREMID
jgi:hypothetical protein